MGASHRKGGRDESHNRDVTDATLACLRGASKPRRGAQTGLELAAARASRGKREQAGDGDDGDERGLPEVACRRARREFR